METTLIEYGIYRLADGREFAAVLVDKGEYALFHPLAWAHGGAAEYTVRSDGKLLSKGIPTRWSVEDLTDTGRAVEPRS